MYNMCLYILEFYSRRCCVKLSYQRMSHCTAESFYHEYVLLKTFTLTFLKCLSFEELLHFISQKTQAQIAFDPKVCN